jgi:hypothetical protein
MAFLEDQRKKDFGKALLLYRKEQCKNISKRFLPKNGV